MARNGSGTYSLPNTAVQTGTAITATDENATRNDIATEITDSWSRSGKGAALAAMSLHDGASATVPDLTYSGDTDTGIGHSAANTLDLIAGGVNQMELTTTAATIVQALTCSTGITATGGAASLTVGTANTSATIKGNRTAADSGADVVTNSVATRTAGNLLEIQNNTTAKLDVDFSGQIKWPSGPASTVTTPAPSAVTAITPNTNITAGSGAAFWKNPFNVVSLKGQLTNATGGLAANLVTTTPLPAGFRPSAARVFVCGDGNGAHVLQILVNTTGAITVIADQLGNAGLINTNSVFLDGITFLAEA